MIRQDPCTMKVTSDAAMNMLRTMYDDDGRKYCDNDENGVCVQSVLDEGDERCCDEHDEDG